MQPDTPAAEENVVFISEQAARTGGAIPPNEHAGDYSTQAPASSPDEHAEELRRRAAELQAALPAFGSHGPVPTPSELTPPPTVDDNPFGDFFSDGPTAWLVDEDEEDQVELRTPRIVGTVLAGLAILMLVAAWSVFGIAMYRDAGGAEAGGFLLLAGMCWVWYLSLERPRQHAAMLRWHTRMQRLVERRVEPLRERTEGQLLLRRERDRYRAMADERTRRINALGEGAYRSFRQGTLAADLQPGAQRVLAIERQMLSQDQRIVTIERERAERGMDDHADEAAQAGGHDRTDAAAPASDNGQPPA